MKTGYRNVQGRIVYPNRNVSGSDRGYVLLLLNMWKFWLFYLFFFCISNLIWYMKCWVNGWSCRFNLGENENAGFKHIFIKAILNLQLNSQNQCDLLHQFWYNFFHPLCEISIFRLFSFLIILKHCISSVWSYVVKKIYKYSTNLIDIGYLLGKDNCFI